MGGLCGWSARRDVSSGKWSRWSLVLLPITVALLVTSGPALGEPQVKRAVLGTVVTAGTLEVALDRGTWKPAAPGSPVIEEAELRTRGGKRGLVALGKHGVLGFSKESHVRIGRMELDGLPVSLEGDSELSFRMPPTTALYFLTQSAVVKGPMVLSSSSADALVQGVIAQRGEETIVTVVEGEVSVRNLAGTELTAVTAGEEIVIASKEAGPRPLAATADAEQKTTRRRLVSAGFLGTRTGLLVAGGTVAAVGIGVGIAVAASGGDGDGERVQQASQFLP